MQNTSKEVIVKEHGKISYEDSLILTKPLGPNDVLIKFVAAPLNPSDYLQAIGKMPGGSPPPYKLGFEGLGLVEKVGDASLQKSVGKRCLFWGLGVYATHVIADKSKVFVLDDDVDQAVVEENFLINALTAHGLLEIVKHEKSPAFIHTVASSNAGKWLTVLAKQQDIASIAIVHSDKHVQRLYALGASVVLNSTKPTFQEDLQAAIATHKPHVLLDALGGIAPTQIFAKLPNKSVFVTYGIYEKDQVDGINFGSLLGGKTVKSYLVFYDTLAEEHGHVEKLVNSLLKNKQAVREETTAFAFDKIEDALKAWEKREKKLIIKA